jgi:3-hydroxybutyryl-CoA dehydrogenase
MNVYNLSDHDAYNVLLTGDVDFVTDFAAVLQASNIQYNIIAPLDDLEDIDVDFDVRPGPSAENMPDPFENFADRLISDINALTSTYTHIIDLSISSNMDRKLTLELASAMNPRATVVVSALTNTATDVGSISNTGDRIIGISIAPGMMTTTKTIDICKGLNTTGHHLEATRDLLRVAGYATEVVEDRVALVQMRVLAMLINEAAFAVMEGLAKPEDIDKAMMLGVNYPKGLLAWADEIGIGVITLILDGLYREYQQERYRPCVQLKQMMRAGWTGKAAGRGFYIYS